MSNCELTIHSNPDAQAWAKYFIHKKEEKNWRIEDIDEPLMLAWFANAMMAMHDHLGSQRTWVGLTEEEENEYNYLGPDMHWVIQEIAAKLKEKNNA
jgi:hypothetical protein